MREMFSPDGPYTIGRVGPNRHEMSISHAYMQRAMSGGAE